MRVLAKQAGVVSVVVGLLVAAPSALSRTSYSRYPSSMVVLAHSGATGYDSDPRQPRTDVKANSWATGTNRAVNSVYLRILAKNPRIKRHNANLAQDGATILELLQQAKRAVKLTPKPELVLVQIMDNDLVCPAARSDYASFRKGVVAALSVVTRGAPKAKIFVVSQFGSPTTQLRAYTRTERLGMAGEGPCDPINSSGGIAKKPLARLEHVIHSYEAQLAAACKQFGACRYDGGAFGRAVDKREYITEDLNHFSVRGHAKAAAIAWAALKRAGLIPR